MLIDSNSIANIYAKQIKRMKLQIAKHDEWPEIEVCMRENEWENQKRIINTNECIEHARTRIQRVIYEFKKKLFAVIKIEDRVVH